MSLEAPSEITTKAKEQAIEIANDLKKTFPGKIVKKYDIVLHYNLPQTRASLIFARLRQLGFRVDRSNLLVPADPPVDSA